MLQKLKNKIIKKLGGLTFEDVSKKDYVTCYEAPVEVLKAGCVVRLLPGKTPRDEEHNNCIKEHAKETIAYNIGKLLLQSDAIHYYMKTVEYDPTNGDVVGMLYFMRREDPDAAMIYGEKI